MTFPARPADLPTAQAKVLDVLQSDAAQRLNGLHASSVAQATGLSERNARVALHRLRDAFLVRQSAFRTARGYVYTAAKG